MQRGNFGQKGHLRCPFYIVACSVTKYVSIFVTFAICFLKGWMLCAMLNDGNNTKCPKIFILWNKFVISAITINMLRLTVI